MEQHLGSTATRRRLPAAAAAAWAATLAAVLLPRGGAVGPAHAADGEHAADLFWRQGFLHVPGFIDESEVQEMRQAMAELIDAWEPAPPEGADGGTAPQAAQSGFRSKEKDYSFMLASATKASIFLETTALGAGGSVPAGADKRNMVRKVAHGLHLVPGPWRDFVHSPKVAETLSHIGWRKPLVAQTLYRLAPPLSAGVDRHQDSVTLFTHPPSAVGIWLALEDADEANGCLRVLPGSHRGTLRERLVRQPVEGCSGEGCGTRLAFVSLSNASRAPARDFVPIRVRRGDVIVMHGTTEHLSEAGTDPARSRESLQVHLVEKTSRWPADNWLQYPDGMQFEELAMPTSGRPSVLSEL